MYLVEVMLLIDFVVAEGAEVDIAAEEGRSKAAAAAEEDGHSMAVEEDNKDDNKAGVAISAGSGLTDLAGS